MQRLLPLLLLLALASSLTLLAQVHTFCASDSNCTYTGNNTFTGSNTFTGPTTFNITGGLSGTNATFSGTVAAVAMIPSVSPWADVRAYGAKCDGATDDTAAFTACFATQNNCYVPAATCVVSNVAVPQAGQLFGAGKTLSTLLQKAGSSGPLVSVNSGNYSWSVRDLTLNGNGAAQGTSVNHGLAVTGAFPPNNGLWSKAERIRILNTTGDCLNVGGQSNTYDDISGFSCGGHGVFVGGAGNTFTKLNFGGTGYEGFYLIYGSENTLSDPAAWFTGTSPYGTITAVALSGGICTYTVHSNLPTWYNAQSLLTVNVAGLTNTACNGTNLSVKSASTTQVTAKVTSAATIATTADSGQLLSSGAGIFVWGLNNTITGAKTQNTAGDGFVLFAANANTISGASAESPGSNFATGTPVGAVGVRIVSSFGNKVDIATSNNPTSGGAGTAFTMAYGAQFDSAAGAPSSRGNTLHLTNYYPVTGDVNINDGYAASFNEIVSMCNGSACPQQNLMNYWNMPVFPGVVPLATTLVTNPTLTGTVTVAGSVIPSATYTGDLGSSSKEWDNGWFAQIVHAASLENLTGQVTPNSQGSIPLGTVALPFAGLYVGGLATNNVYLTATATAARVATLPDGNSSAIVVAALTTTSATSDNVTVQGMTSTGHCSLTATNASAATNIATTYVSAKTANQITVTHAVTSGMTYDVMCSAI